MGNYYDTEDEKKMNETDYDDFFCICSVFWYKPLVWFYLSLLNCTEEQYLVFDLLGLIGIVVVVIVVVAQQHFLKK